MKFNPRVYWLFYWLIRGAYRILLVGNIKGLENIPNSGALIMASNHASHFDPPILGCNLRRVVVYFARKTLWKPGFASWWLDAVGAIPIDRDGESDIQARKTPLRALKAGAALSLFPEGTRSPDENLQPAKPGIGLIAAKSQAMVIPCRIFNTNKALSRNSKLPNFSVSVHVVYGKPLKPKDYDPGKDAGKERYQLIANNIMAAISQITRPRTQAI